jgi:hypothetical protein
MILSQQRDTMNVTCCSKQHVSDPKTLFAHITNKVTRSSVISHPSKTLHYVLEKTRNIFLNNKVYLRFVKIKLSNN